MTKKTVCVLPTFVSTLLVLVSSLFPATAQEVSIPDPGLNSAIRETLGKPVGPLTQQDLLGLINLFAISRNITNLQGLEAARNLNTLLLDDNHITDVNVLSNLTSLSILDLSENPITNLTIPAGLTNLTRLRLENGQLTQITLPAAGLTKLTDLGLGFNQLTSLTLPTDMTNLSVLSLFQNQLTNLTLPPKLPNLTQLILAGNQLNSLNLPAGLTKLNTLIASENQLTNFIVPADLTNLNALRLSNNQLTSLTLPPDITKLNALFLDGNPLATLVLSEPLAATNLAATIVDLQNQGVTMHTYPLIPQLVRPLPLIAAFKFGIKGPPGVYSVLASTNLAAWSVVGVATNPLGSVNFHDVITNAPPQKFYRVLLQIPPANMVLISSNTFVMGSPTNELHRNVNEGPQTTVTLTHGYWIGKYEVTQGEYLDVTGTNPSVFPGDLSRPVSSVSWPEATNYCWLLTQRERADGRISPGSEYRLPTEAEWECAARAGTTTRFSYGDDLDYSNLTNHAWYWQNAGFSAHPVGQKLPNPWGLYDMEGNVWEWCQDWLGNLPGGAVTDPQGPATNPIGWKIVRGGGYDFGEADCRSARRFFFGNHPALNDSNLGFRVVLVAE